MTNRDTRRCRRSPSGTVGFDVFGRLLAWSMLVVLAVVSGCGQQSPLPQYDGGFGASDGSAAVDVAVDVATVPPAADPPAATAPAPTAVGGEAFLPTRLLLDTIGVDAPVIEVGVADRVLGVPDDPRQLGRWSDGARPNDRAGSIVLTGHVDYQGLPGALRPLADLQPGDEAVLTGDGGQQSRYVTDRVDVFSKTALPYQEIFQYDVAERLVLITCGGRFDLATGHYDSNVVAYLRRV